MSEIGTSAAIQAIAGKGVPLRGDDIDTDQIMPARYLKWITFKGLEAHVFADTRAACAREARLHPFDDPKFSNGKILITNRNFGCGSSREHAPQAIKRFGFAAIIGESFGEIFAGNCVAIGMPCVMADAETIQRLQELCEKDSATELTLDLTSMTIRAGAWSAPVDLSEGRRQQFLDGAWDSTAVLLSAAALIETRLEQLPLPRITTS